MAVVMGSFHGITDFHGIPRTKFSRYQNRQGHGIIYGTILSDWTVDSVLR